MDEPDGTAGSAPAAPRQGSSSRRQGNQTPPWPVRLRTWALTVDLARRQRGVCRLSRRRPDRALGSVPSGPVAQPEQAENGKDNRDAAAAAAVVGTHGGI